jgi:hypothetical protein
VPFVAPAPRSGSLVGRGMVTSKPTELSRPRHERDLRALLRHRSGRCGNNPMTAVRDPRWVGSRSLGQTRSRVVVIRAWVGSEDNSFRARVIESVDGASAGTTTAYSSPDEVTAAVAGLLLSLTQGADPPRAPGGARSPRR